MTLQTPYSAPTTLSEDARLVAQASLPTYDANSLTQNGTQAQILLGDQTYFLRITRAGKLILTK